MFCAAALNTSCTTITNAWHTCDVQVPRSNERVVLFVFTSTMQLLKVFVALFAAGAAEEISSAPSRQLTSDGPADDNATNASSDSQQTAVVSLMALAGAVAVGTTLHLSCRQPFGSFCIMSWLVGSLS